MLAASTEKAIDKAVSGRPRINTATAPVSGIIRQTPEDFVVEEIPVYQPSGDGEHLFLWIEKRDLSGEQLRNRIAQALGVEPLAIGMAGLKDRRAVTRQFVSVPARCESRVADIECDNCRILDTRRHQNKLRTGHLKGNRFSILVRQLRPLDSPDDRSSDTVNDQIALARSNLSGCPAAVPVNVVSSVRSAIDSVISTGFANYFGPQRFGYRGETARDGFSLLGRQPEKRPRNRGLRGSRRRLAISAAQSVLFNLALSSRVSDGLIHRVLVGDVMQRRCSGGLFVAAGPELEQQRFDRRETVITGPIFGPKMIAPELEPADRERRLLESVEVPISAFSRFRGLARGTRRPMIVWPDSVGMSAEVDGMHLVFSLPAGTYATVLLSELFGHLQTVHGDLDGSGLTHQ